MKTSTLVELVQAAQMHCLITIGEGLPGIPDDITDEDLAKLVEEDNEKVMKSVIEYLGLII